MADLDINRLARKASGAEYDSASRNYPAVITFEAGYKALAADKPTILRLADEILGGCGYPRGGGDIGYLRGLADRLENEPPSVSPVSPEKG